MLSGDATVGGGRSILRCSHGRRLSRRRRSSNAASLQMPARCRGDRGGRAGRSGCAEGKHRDAAARLGRADLYRQRRRLEPEGESDLLGLLPGCRARPCRRHGRLPRGRERRAAYGHARDTREQRRSGIREAVRRAAEQSSGLGAQGGRQAARPVPAGPRRRGSGVGQSLLPRCRRCSLLQGPLRADVADRVQRQPEFLQQRLARLQCQVHGSPVELDSARHVSLPLSAPPRGDERDDHCRPVEQVGAESERSVGVGTEAAGCGRGAGWTDRRGGPARPSGSGSGEARQAPASVTAGTAPVLAGGPAGIDEYGPKTVKIPVGGSVTWYLLGPHSITFNSTKANNDIRRVAPDGTVHINSAAIAPAGGPGEPGRPPTGGSQAHPKLVVVARTTWNGSGFLNSGVFGNSHGPPTIEGYRITFTRAGTYRYLCTAHDHMKGTIVVGG